MTGQHIKNGTRIIGFIGEERGMTDGQRETTRHLLKVLHGNNYGIARHGMAEGAVDEFHVMARQQGYYITGHPGCDTNGEVASKTHLVCDETQDPKPFRERNKDIIFASDSIIAVPHTAIEPPRTATWAAVREALRQGKQMWVVLPSGNVQFHPGRGKEYDYD